MGNRLTRVSGPPGAGLIMKMPPIKWLAEAMAQKSVTSTRASKTATRHNIAGVSDARLQKPGSV